MSSTNEKALNETYQKIFAISTNQASLDGVEDLVASDVMGYGATRDEKISGLEEFRLFIEGQEEQAKAAGLDFKFVPDRVHQRISPKKDVALFIEEIVATLTSGETIVQQFKFRFSAHMELIEGQWKLVHWHGSIPVDTENDTWHIDKFKKENERLEKLVAQQTSDLQQKNSELEIEAASERVRAVAMGMQEPDDIMNVLNVMKKEVDKFDLGNIATWIWTKDEEDLITQWDISEVIEEDNLVNFNLQFDVYNAEKNPEVNRHVQEWEKGKKYYELNWKGEKLQDIVDEVGNVDPESGKLFQEAVDVGQIKEYWHAAAPYSKGVVGLDFISDPPEITESILFKMSSAFDMAYQRFEDLQKAEAQTREAQIELSLERIRAQVSAMHESSELLDIVVTMRSEFVSLGHEAHYFWYMRWHPEHYEKAMTSGDGSKIGMVMTLPRLIHSEIEPVAEWEKGEEDTMVLAMDTDMAVDYVDKMIKLGDFEKIDPQAPTLDDIRHIGGLTFVMARTSLGEIGFSLPGVVKHPSEEALTTLTRFASVFDLAYQRFEDLKKAEKQAYESKVEASLERVRGMAAAMNHSDDLMQIAEAMFKEMEILKINPLRYGIGMIDGKKQEAELWASTVDDGHYLDMLGTLSLTWHPMLQQVLDAWDAQYEELIYELKGKELSDYYQKVGPINPEIPDLKALQDPDTTEVQFVSFFPFKSGALYAFTNGEPGEDGKSILKRFANVFEQAHIRYDDLQIAEKQARLIREERDRLEIALKELESTKDQLVQQEKLASLGQLTAGIAHEIKNPLNFVNNFSDLSIELIEEIREELLSEKAKVKGEKSADEGEMNPPP
jgi:hypothetical protein